jgi:putative hemolysin
MSVDGPLPEDAPLPTEPPRVAPLANGFEELRAGNLGLRVAESEAEVEAAQALRYRVFYEEMGARADEATRAARRDRDDFDAIADHLLVLDHDLGHGPEAVVGPTG